MIVQTTIAKKMNFILDASDVSSQAISVTNLYRFHLTACSHNPERMTFVYKEIPLRKKCKQYELARKAVDNAKRENNF